MNGKFFFLLLLFWSGTALTQQPFTQSGSAGGLYWELGGHSLIPTEDLRLEKTFRFKGEAHASGLNICGKFAPKVSVQGMFQQLDDLLATLDEIPQTVLKSLPGYIFCRAKPGLCQLLQDYTARLEAQYMLHVRTCESAIKAAAEGNNPYFDWITVATAETWNEAANTRATTADAYKNAIEKRDAGIYWIGGQRAGGRGQKNIQPIRDIASAGWCLAQRKKPNCETGDADSIYSKYWKTPTEFRHWIATVLGDIGLWTYEGAPPPHSIPSFGLDPVLKEHEQAVRAKLDAVLTKNFAPDEDLEALSARSFGITREIIAATKFSKENNWLVANFANRIALAQVLERALLARKLLYAGRKEPNVQAVAAAHDWIELAMRHLEDEIDLILYDSKAKNELLINYGKSIMHNPQSSSASQRNFLFKQQQNEPGQNIE